jgi:uncharacterized membrane protein YidH (DUF202 family)
MDHKVNVTDHLANERTFLAWIRTGIALMAFGFVVVKFALFVKQVSFILGQGHPEVALPNHGYSAVIGIALVAFGTLISLLSFIRYKQIQRQLLENNFRPSVVLSMFVTVLIILVGLLLVVYLVPSV